VGSAWRRSDAFFCLKDRAACATMKCKECGHVFEADVERQEQFVMAPVEGSAWTSMLLKCPVCPNQESDK
jgi:rubredoxin